ncbi:MAG: hypothetical protein R6W94_13635 [Spirochaetia bacterium]
MALTKEDLELVGDYVKAHLDEWASERVLRIGERLGNVESELKSQREFMVARFESIDQRFEDMNRRFDDQSRYMNQRFDDQSRYMNRWFTVMTIMLTMIAALVTVGSLGW